MIVMIATKGFVYDALKFGLAKQNKGTFELTEEFANQLAEGAAKNLGKEVVRVWHDHRAGGVFAELK